MAGTKAQKAARQRRVRRTAELIYYHAELRPKIALVAPVWEDLTDEEREQYQTLANLAVEAYEANPS